MASSNNPVSWAARVVRDAFLTWVALLRIMIPVVILVKIAKELKLIDYLAMPLDPLMAFLGLPREMGLVWATAVVNNIYGALVVFSSLAERAPLTVAQATVLGLMILVAHNLPVEIKIAQASGARWPFQTALRLCGAVMLGFLASRLMEAFGVLGEPAVVVFKPSPESADLMGWALGEARNLLMILAIIAGLLAFVRFLDLIRATGLIHRVLNPVFGRLGIGQEASALTVIGLTMGIAYGGGLIIKEAGSGKIKPDEVFRSLGFLGLCHSLFEDSLLLATIGGSFSVLLWGRLFFAFLVTALIFRLTRNLGEAAAARWFYGPGTALVRPGSVTENP